MKLFEYSAQSIRFAIVGIVVATIYVVGYSVLTAMGVTTPRANAVSFLTAIVVQYVLHSTWTFKRPLMVGRQWLRFATLVTVSFAYSVVLTSFVGPALDRPEWQAAVLAAVTLPIINFLTMRFWVYSSAKYGESQ